jgi:hypothetical protein
VQEKKKSITSFFKKGLSENPWQRLSLITLSPLPIWRDHNPFEKKFDRKTLATMQPFSEKA